MTDSAREIENLLYTYADRIDRGDFDGVADLFDARPHPRPSRAVDRRRSSRVATGCAALYGMTTRIHEDTGTPRTKHLTTNAIIEVDDEAGTATAQSNYLVTQATPSCRCR